MINSNSSKLCEKYFLKIFTILIIIFSMFLYYKVVAKNLKDKETCGRLIKAYFCSSNESLVR